MTTKTNSAFAVLALLWSVFGLVGSAQSANPVANADELVARHLDSIASASVRTGLKTRVVQGPAEFKILVGGAGVQEGKSFLVSEGNKLVFVVKFPNIDYRGEQFTFNGEKDSVAFSNPQQVRSPFGNFVFVQDAVIREGLLGGALSTAWPLLDVKERKAKLSFDGLKKVEGQELYELRYRPNKNSDLEISLYFDPETYRHVETIYNYSVSQNFAPIAPSAMAGKAIQAGGPSDSGTPTITLTQPTRETAMGRQLPNRYRLQEKFSDFKTVDGVTLPTHEDLQFTQELQNGRTILWDWDLKSLDISNNIGVDARNFEVK